MVCVASVVLLIQRLTGNTSESEPLFLTLTPMVTSSPAGADAGEIEMLVASRSGAGTSDLPVSAKTENPGTTTE